MIGKSFQISHFPFLIGRSASCAIAIPADAHLYKRNARINLVGQRAAISCMVKAVNNGGEFVECKTPLFVKSRRVHQEGCILKDGDFIQIGTHKTALTLHVEYQNNI